MNFTDFGIEVNENRGHARVSCPQCSFSRQPKNQHKKDLSVNVDKGVWFCHHCGWAGSLEKKATVTITAKRVKPINVINTEWLYDYFSKRGITRATVDKFGIKEHYHQVNGVSTREIAFPFFLGETLYNYKFRSVDKDFRQVSGIEFQGFFNINSVINSEVAVITEGEIDAMSFVEAGIETVISVPNGAPNADAKEFHKEFKYLDDTADILGKIDTFYLALDMDRNGLRLREELARRLGKKKCFIVEFPHGCKDANDVLQKYGVHKLSECLNSAFPFPVEGVFATNDFRDEIRHIYAHGYPNGAKTGWRELDEHISFYPGQLTVVTGVPNAAKSPWTDNVMMNLSEREDWRCAVFSPENGAISNHIIRLIRQKTRKNFFPGYNNRCTSKESEDAMEFINEHFHFIKPENERYTIDKILEGFEYTVAKYGVRFVLIDPWNTLEHQKPKDESETNYVGRMLNKFKYFARDCGVHFMLIAHPKIPEKYTNNYIPNLYGISGSANWYNIPDIGVVVHRHMKEDRSTTEYNMILIEKMKFDWVGKRGKVKMNFDLASQRFSEWGKQGVETAGEYAYGRHDEEKAPF